MKGSVKFYEGRGWVVQYYDPKGKKRIFKAFRQEDDARIFQASLNVRAKEGILDARDYAKDNPLGFMTQAERWLDVQAENVKDIRHLRHRMNVAISYFGKQNVKEIGYANLEDYLSRGIPKGLAGKTKHDYITTLKTFWRWLGKRERDRGLVIPDFPEVKFTLGWRQTVDRETQTAILNEVRRISFDRNPRIWFGIFLLANFPKVRPGELIQIKEGDIDRRTGEVWIRHTKEGKEKRIYLLQADLEFIRALPQGVPALPFFRHAKLSGVTEGTQFADGFLLRWWNHACRNLGIKGVGLYGGTKHSTVTAAREFMTPEEIRRYVTEHQTNAAFDRYLQVDAQKQREASGRIRAHTSCINEKEEGVGGKVLKLRG